MNPSPKCIALIKHYELFMPNPYLCPAGVPTIGYGTTVYPDGKKVTLKDHKVTEPEACEFLEHDTIDFTRDVNTLLKVKVTQEQFDALVSFAYNVGPDIDADTIAEGLGDSTLLRLINANIMQTTKNWKAIITKEFLKWDKARNRKTGLKEPLPGLTARRQAEAWLFCEGQLKFFAAPTKK